jgi:hypothetical protein
MALESTLSYIFFLGVTLFAAGILWLFYENARLSREFSNDYNGLTWRIWWATVIALIGVIVFGYAGLLIAAA